MKQKDFEVSSETKIAFCDNNSFAAQRWCFLCVNNHMWAVLVYAARGPWRLQIGNRFISQLLKWRYPPDVDGIILCINRGHPTICPQIEYLVSYSVMSLFMYLAIRHMCKSELMSQINSNSKVKPERS